RVGSYWRSIVILFSIVFDVDELQLRVFNTFSWEKRLRTKYGVVFEAERDVEDIVVSVVPRKVGVAEAFSYLTRADFLHLPEHQRTTGYWDREHDGLDLHSYHFNDIQALVERSEGVPASSSRSSIASSSREAVAVVSAVEA
ncbi:unnamed protein product, partial [Amoebophrya sp. A25]